MTGGLLLFFQALDYGESLVGDALSSKVIIINGGHFLNT